MFRKIIAISLALLLAIGSFSTATFATVDNDRESPGVARRASAGDAKITREKLDSLFKDAEMKPSLKSTIAEYERTQARGRGFSKGKKIALGVGIAIGVVAIAVFAASRDEIRTF